MTALDVFRGLAEESSNQPEDGENFAATEKRESIKYSSKGNVCFSFLCGEDIHMVYHYGIKNNSVCYQYHILSPS